MLTKNTFVRMAVLYLVVGVTWSALVSVQRASMGFDAVDAAFWARAFIRLLLWPLDLAVVVGIPPVVVLAAYAIVAFAAITVYGRRARTE